jgi:hypothetical protein
MGFSFDHRSLKTGAFNVEKKFHMLSACKALARGYEPQK